jgi:phosphatidylglycerophosphate synthase
MRNADAVSILRIPLLLLLVYAISVRADAAASLVLLAILFVSDAADGYLTFDEKLSMSDFVHYLFEEARLARKRERSRPKTPRYAAFLDIGVDRLIEYALWLTFVLLSVTPWFVLAIVFLRNTIADALVLRKRKAFSEMHTGFGRIASSHVSRGAYAVLKAVNFAYLVLVATAGWPISAGYALTAAVVVFSLFRGAAEIYEATR